MTERKFTFVFVFVCSLVVGSVFATNYMLGADAVTQNSNIPMSGSPMTTAPAAFSGSPIISR